MQNYSMNDFRKDVLAGVVVGVIAIPLGMAFAIASGVRPEYGIYTTIIAGMLISIFGGSKFQIGGPTGAFVPVLLSIVLMYGYENLLIAGFMAGVFLLLMGILKLGALIKFIPRPVIIGFTSGIAVIIFSGQIANFLGLRGIEQHEDFLSNMKEILVHLNTINPYSLAAAFICLFFILVTPKFLPKVPSALVGLLVSSLAATYLFPGQTATIASSFGNIPNSLPEFQIPEFTWEKIHVLIGPAFTIAVLGAIESLLSAVVADGMTGKKHNSNRELAGQGIANMVTPLFGGIPATGAIARTATNIKNGAVSPVSGVIHSLTVLLVLLILAPYASLIPLASMAPILMVVAWNMSERKEFARILLTKTGDSAVLLITFGLTVFADLTIAVEVGLLLSILLFVKRMSTALKVDQVVPDPIRKKVRPLSLASKPHGCPQVHLFTVEGALFFGAAQLFEQALHKSIQDEPNVLILRMSKVPYIDTTGENMLKNVVKDFQARGVTIFISGVQAQPKDMMKRTGLYDMIGETGFFAHTGEAINAALTQLNKSQCLGCQQYAFRECTALSAPSYKGELL
ncbi:SulP family inorganic anion transporter [Bacillus thermotolerans]|uniref:Sulfate permease n=1 Tax=Bacillus thermotolerans TaxID=1221996 RepID=A0A0F5HKP5_BACTR|nr:sulfate permease [Bacillus thermotolerans]KKB33876.1 Sulfate permease [Bacillus thermotolerans]KKB36724.1 Sulfate permease [Bacillus thermotolerans]